MTAWIRKVLYLRALPAHRLEEDRKNLCIRCFVPVSRVRRWEEENSGSSTWSTLPTTSLRSLRPGRSSLLCLRDAAADAEGRRSAAPAVTWPVSPPAVSSSYLAPRARVWLARWSLWLPSTPFSASFADSGTRSWSVVPSGRVHARSLFAVVASDSD